MSTSRKLVKSAARAFEILESFKRARKGLRLREVVADLGYPTSSVAELLTSMTAQGYLSFDDKTRKYMPSARLAGLVNWIPTDAFRQETVIPAMQRLQKLTGQLIVLGAMSDIYLEYVETMQSNERGELNIRAGARRLLVQSHCGWLLLGDMPKSEAIAVYTRTVARGALRPKEFPIEEFFGQLAKYRGAEISFSTAKEIRGPAHWDGAMVAMRIPVPEHHGALAIGISGLSGRLNEKRSLISAALKLELEHITAAVSRHA